LSDLQHPHCNIANSNPRRIKHCIPTAGNAAAIQSLILNEPNAARLRINVYDFLPANRRWAIAATRRFQPFDACFTTFPG
jgi:hypothetical protein